MTCCPFIRVLPVLLAGMVSSLMAQQVAAPAAASAQAPAVAPAAAPAANAASDASVEGYLFFASNDATAPEQEEKVTADAVLLTSLEGRLKKVFPIRTIT